MCDKVISSTYLDKINKFPKHFLKYLGNLRSLIILINPSGNMVL